MSWTADTITDEMIRALRNEPLVDFKRWFICTLALDEDPEDNPVADRAEITRAARRRCAEIYNERKKSGTP